MKDSYLINFSLFCLKRKFNLLTYLTKNENVSYEQFSDLMRSKSVSPPDPSYFSNVKSKADSIRTAKKSEAILLENALKVDTKKVDSKIEKPKRKRRSKKKVTQKSDND